MLRGRIREGREVYACDSFWLLYYTTDQAAQANKDPDPKSRAMQVWFDDIVLASLILLFQGGAADRILLDDVEIIP